MLPAVLVPDYTFQQHLILVCVNAAFELYSHLMLSPIVLLRSNRGNKLLGTCYTYTLLIQQAIVNIQIIEFMPAFLRVIIVTTLCTSKCTQLNYDRKAI